MKPTQIYWLTWIPSLVLLFAIFGLEAVLIVLVPSFLVYWSHEKEWDVLTFTVVAAILTLFALGYATVGMSYFTGPA